MAGAFVVTQRANDEFQFSLRAGNGQTILSSEGYKAKNGKLYYTLKAGNGQVVGTSQMYADVSGRDGGIQSVVQNAPTAGVDDQTVGA